MSKQPQQTGIQQQIVLPWSKAWEISLKSLKIRFWRSFITTGGIVLAIAFLAATLTRNAVVGRMRQAVEQVKGVSLPREADEAAKKSWRARRNQADRLDRLLTKNGEGLADDPQEKENRRHKQYWLVALALLVAFVGIVNAMLMSVHERFREIGTMKCLGALDTFIMKLFLLESTLQGMLGTLAGLLLGVVLMVVKLALDFPGFLLENVPQGEVALYAFCAFLAGTVISILGAILPARTAAAMEPVVAMRVDN